MDLDVEGYAALMAELALAGDRRAAVLARHWLDEARWEAVDARWQARLSEAMADDGDGVPEVLAAWAAAYERAQRAQAPISLERFAAVTRIFQATGDITAALSRVGVAFAEYVRASEHWSGRMAQDPELERRFVAALRGENGLP